MPRHPVEYVYLCRSESAEFPYISRVPIGGIHVKLLPRGAIILTRLARDISEAKSCSPEAML